MSLKDLNVEPNILLILLGSLFVLIGASGKIFIEKFSVAVASIGPRFLISVLGLAMLGLGIVGPNKLVPDPIGTGVVQPGPIIQDGSKPNHSTQGPWFHRITGTYSGIVTSSGIDYPVNTTFNVDAKRREPVGSGLLY